MIDLVTPFALPYMQRPLLLLLALAVAAGTVGMIVNLRRLEFISDGLTHAVFPGLVIGFIVAGDPGLMAGALAAAIVAAVLLTLASRRGTGDETGIAIVLTSFFSIGVVLVSTRSEYAGQLQELFFGRLLTVTADALWISIAALAVAIGIVVVTWRQQVFRAFDERGARAAGLATLRGDILANIAVALFVVAAASSVGTLLVLAILIVPAAAARAVTRDIGAAVAVAIVFAGITSWLGLAVAFASSVDAGIDVAPGATVATTMVVVYLAVLVVSQLVRRRPRRATARSFAEAEAEL